MTLRLVSEAPPEDDVDPFDCRCDDYPAAHLHFWWGGHHIAAADGYRSDQKRGQ